MRGLDALPLSFPDDLPPVDYLGFLRDADRITQDFNAETGPNRIPGLVSTDGQIAWKFLQAAKPHLSVDTPRFCEWGSGLGIVTSLASQMGWNAVGLEIEPSLIDAARDLAAKHEINASFCQTSYKPEAIFEPPASDTAFETGHGFGLFDFDVIYAYFWPAERDVMTQAFARHAREGTLLLRYGGGLQCDAFRVSRS